MYDFNDQLDELGEDFGLFNTPSFIRHKYEELNSNWLTLIAPYRGIGSGTAIPPNQLLVNYRAWQRVYDEYEASWFNTLFAAGAISIWKDEAKRYTRTFDYLEELRRINPGPGQEQTPSPSASGAPRLNLPADIPSSSNGFSLPSGGGQDRDLFHGINFNIGTIAVLSIAGLFAYNIFFRLKEGRRKGI